MSTTTKTTKSSPRSVAHPPDREDINNLVEEAAKRFEDMDEQMKLLIEQLKRQHASMIEMNNCRFETAKHLESLLTKTPLAPVVSGAPSVEETAKKPAPKDESHEPKEEEATKEKKDKDDAVSASEETKVTDNRTPPPPPPPPTESFMAVHKSIHELGNTYQQQYQEDLIQYAEEWESTVSDRVHGLLIHYRELHQHALHYQKKVLDLHNKADHRPKATRLFQKLDRNEVKEMGAYETRDMAGESLWLFIDEVVTRAWRDILPLLYRACHFEASFSYQQASLFASLNMVNTNLQSIGDDWGCDLTGRLEELAKKHTEEVYTAENPFVKLKPLKAPQVEEQAPKDDLAVVPDDEVNDFAPDEDDAQPVNDETNEV